MVLVCQIWSSMASLRLPSLLPFNRPPSSPPVPFSFSSRTVPTPLSDCPNLWLRYHTFPPFDSICASYGFYSYTEEEDDCDGGGFKEAVELFNGRDYYKCHDVLEDLWNREQEPSRTIVHGILQCAVGFHHLFNQNHKGAMMELGEGLCKLRKMNFEDGPFLQFEQEISAVLDFIYQTQLELAACAEDLCVTLDQSERSYQLLGGYAAGQRLYCLQSDPNEIMHIVFCPESSHGTPDPPRVKLPTLHASEDHLKDHEYCSGFN